MSFFGVKKQDGFPGQLSYVIPDRILSIVRQNPICADLYLTDIGYYPHASYHFREREEGVSQAILIYNIGGQGIITVNNSRFLLPADHFFIIPPDIPHAYYADEKNPWTIYWIHFSGHKANHFAQLAFQTVPVERNKTSRINERIELFTEIFQEPRTGLQH